MRIRFFYFCIVFLLFLTSCSVTKFVPEGEYLLDKVEIKSDNKEVKKEELKKYVHQMPNSSVFGIWRMQLRIFSTAGRDTTKWINRVFTKAGEAPVIYNPTQTYLSEQYLRKALQNKGFIYAEVGSEVKLEKKKALVNYIIKENVPYRLRDYSLDIPNEELASLARDSENTLIKQDMLFDVDVFDAERERITNEFRQRGYYKFTKDLLVFSADSTLNSKQVDVTMKLQEFNENVADSIRSEMFNKYYIRRVVFVSSPDFDAIKNDLRSNIDKFNIERKGKYVLINDEKEFLRMSTLIENTFVQPDMQYSDAVIEKTYSALNALAPVKYVNVSFRQSQNDSLDCVITIAPNKLVSLTTEVEATYTEGFWGVAANVGTVHRNVFKGAESLSLQGRLAYEWQQDVLAQEWGVQAGLLFPNFLIPFTTPELRRFVRANTEFISGYNYQNRPGEFKVTNLNVGMKYAWTHYQFRHTWELVDLSFVHFPEISQDFYNQFIATNKFNRYNYDDHLIMRMGYIGSFSTFNRNRPMKNYVAMRYSLETAGNLLYGINSLFGGKKDKDDAYTVGGIRYSQYFRADYNVTYHQIIDSNNRFVYHFGFGAGTPYGNADIIPYERRYFSGGANSVRGWSESMLGPGAYKRDEQFRRRRDYNQVGDIKLDINAEYRFKMFGALDGALFLDGGNVWTVKPYESQLGGEFRFNTFLNQIALSYGVGVRLDVSFVVIRLDMGVKLYNPALESDRWRTSFSADDFAFHFAIGYPF